MVQAQSVWLMDLAARQPSILHGESPAILDRIRERGVGLCLWQRKAPAEIRRNLDALAFGDLPCGRVLVPRRHVEEAITSILESAQLACTPLERFLVEDIATFLPERSAR